MMLLPLAWGLVNGETNDNIRWFLDTLLHSGGHWGRVIFNVIPDGAESIYTHSGLNTVNKNIIILMDRGKALMSSVPAMLPDAYIQQCCVHLWRDVEDNSKRFKNCGGKVVLDLCKPLFWACTTAITLDIFTRRMRRILKISKQIYTYLWNIHELRPWALYAVIEAQLVARSVSLPCLDLNLNF